MMKHLKSTLQDLRQIFDRTLTVRHVAESFLTFDGPRAALEIRAFMKDHNFDVVGVRQNGIVDGYVKGSDLRFGTLEDHLTRFNPDQQVDETTSILGVLRLLRDSPRAFVVVMGHVSGIVTKGDLHKAPVRIYIFGVLSLLEMQFLRLIRSYLPDDSWTRLLSDNRIKKAKKLLDERRRQNEEIDLGDCLQFGDKVTIVRKSPKLRAALGFDPAGKAKTRLKKLRKLRDDLVHAQDIITGRWPELVDILEHAEDILRRAEELRV